ncbi:MAG: hypothetical protein ABIK76_05605 [candidate division WOR-3 bacterium]
MNYFLISVSNRQNLDLCIKYARAGFTNSINGAWTFLEVNNGDYISFLYGAQVFNLYEVVEKKAIKNAENIGPWPPVTFSMSRRTYYFPFRVYLKPLREFTEPMVRPEFSYVAENLLLRGGYRRTHFQADRTTLQVVSQMGNIYNKPIDFFRDNSQTFEVLFIFKNNKNKDSPPEIFFFQEIILHSLIRQHLSIPQNLQDFFGKIGLNNLCSKDFEVLGEKALPEGHVDILIKEHSPRGHCKKIIIEIKTGKLQKKDLTQIKKYMDELGEECIKGVLIGKDASRILLKLLNKNKENITCLKYSFEGLDNNKNYSFEKLKSCLTITQL